MQTLPHEKQIQEYAKTITQLKKQMKNNPIFQVEVERLEQKLEELKKNTYSSLTAWDRVLISRHSSRPHTIDYIKALSTDFIELHGDRTSRDDASVIGGLAKIDGIPFVLIGQEKGSDTNERIMRNFGMVSPEGFRKALRLMKLAETLQIPVVSFLDTPGAYPGLEAEEKGQGRVIAENLQAMFGIETPILVIIIGEGCSGGALGMGVGDSIAILEHAYYTVISPEGCASILWKNAAEKQRAAEALKLNSEHLLSLGIVDEIILEPLGGAHNDVELMFQRVKDHILEATKELQEIPSNLLIQKRYAKFRIMGNVE
ncbi:MAG: acetyl-CoA carboxylase carboxyltransferase subunit alpha [Chlamydia sp.]